MSKDTLTILGYKGFIGSSIVNRVIETKEYIKIQKLSVEEALNSTKSLGDVIFAIGLTADFRYRVHDTVDAHVSIINEILRKNNFDRLIYLSSTRLYSCSNSVNEDAKFTLDPYNLSDIYNISKLMGESICLNSSKNVIVARLSNVIGIRKDSDLFIDQLLEEGRINKELTLKTTLDSSKDYIHIDDVIDLLLCLAKMEDVDSRIYNIASGDIISNEKIIHHIKKEYGWNVLVSQNAMNWTFSQIDITKIKEQFGYKPRNFNTYFPKYLRDYRNLHNF